MWVTIPLSNIHKYTYICIYIYIDMYMYIINAAEESPYLVSGFFFFFTNLGFFFFFTNLLMLCSKSFPDNKKGIQPGQFSSVAHLCPTLCYHMDCSISGFPVHHQPLNFAQTHVHQVSDAIQPSHPLLSSSPPAFNLSLQQGLFQ